MKKKVSISLLVIFLLISITGCNQSNENLESTPKDTANETSANYDVVGTWSLKNKINTSNSYQYSSIESTFGSCLNSSDNQLTLNEDNTFSLYVGCAYNMTGNYTIENNIITFSNIKDTNIKNENTLKRMQEDLKIEVIEYNNETMLQMKTDIDQYVDVYIYFGNNNEDYDANTIPEMKFNEEHLSIGEYTLDYGLYTGTYQTTQTESMADAYTVTIKLKLNKDNTISIYDEVLGDYYTQNYMINSRGQISFGSSYLEVTGNNTLKLGDTTLKYADNQ